MMKKWIVFFTSFILMTSPVLAGIRVNRMEPEQEISSESEAETITAADGTKYKEKATKVFTDGNEAGELVLRFYEETPNVPYMGIGQYSAYMKQQPLTLREIGDGTYALVNGIGEELLCDPEAGVITVKDWGRFFDLPLPLEDRALGWKDTTVHYVRITDVAYEGEAKPVELDFAKYGIKLYADQDDIYLPVSTVTNMMTDIATNYLRYNGENLFAQRIDFYGSDPEGFWESEILKAQIQGTQRPEDLVKQCYADLCFTFDYFFGHPGIAAMDEALAEKGLDQAISDLGEEGAAIKEGLLSSDLSEYVSAMLKLFLRYLSDGHTTFLSGLTISYVEAAQSNKAFEKKVSYGIIEDTLKSPASIRQLLHELISVQRSLFWGDNNYREYGNTAIIRLDSFMPDEKAWADFYDGKGDFPEDTLGNVVSGLKKASENPDIRNVILDLSCNSGGSPDVMMGILALTTGQTELYGINKITGQRMTFTFEADSNFDGVYDEKDKEVRYDFNYGVLVTRHAFSCGNLFPFIIKEGGAVLIGEPSSGGSCCVQMGTDANGLFYIISSAQWQLTDGNGMTVEGGCPIDLPIEAKSLKLLDKVISITGVDDGAPSFMKYFDDARLNNMMNEYFSEEAAADAAA